MWITWWDDTTIFGVLGMAPGFGIIKGNMKNECNKIIRECVINAIRESDIL